VASLGGQFDVKPLMGEREEVRYALYRSFTNLFRGKLPFKYRMLESFQLSKR
jgi:hypothetical protein